MTEETTPEESPLGEAPPRVSLVRRALHIAKVVAVGVGIGLLAVILLAVLAAAVFPPSVPDSSPEPATGYGEALGRIADLQARDVTNEVGYGTIFMGQGSKVATAVVLMHGYTNHPEQFRKIGEAYHEAGYNVLIPRFPGHGMRDTMSTALSELDAAALVTATDEAIDIAAGLGETVEVVGLSGGGTMAVWAGYNRDEVTSAITVSPFLDPAGLPVPVMRPVTEIVHVMPDFFVWWDPRAKDDHVPAEAYPRFSLHSLSAYLDVGADIVRKDPQRTTPLARAVYVSNASDASVDEEYGDKVFEEHVGAMADEVEFYEFDESLGYAHDVIDYRGANAEHIGEIYTQFYEWLGMPLYPRSTAE